MQLIVVRHGQTLENAKDIVMGHHGGTLSEAGVAQAEATATALKNETFDQAWSSDLKRCMDTARIILKYHPGLELKPTVTLREVNYGEFQGRPGTEIRSYFDEFGFNVHSKVPGGESHTEMGARVIKFVNNLFEAHSDEKVLLVTHNGPIEAIRAAVEHTPFTKDSDNAAVHTFDIANLLEPYNA